LLWVVHSFSAEVKTSQQILGSCFVWLKCI
jgi:hypothetical protein